MTRSPAARGTLRVDDPASGGSEPGAWLDAIPTLAGRVTDYTPAPDGVFLEDGAGLGVGFHDRAPTP